jgi:hypothetical protein
MEEDNWNTVSVQNAEQEEQIEIEFEEEPEKKPEIKVEEKEETKVEIEQEEPVKEEVEAEEPELEGIKTQGAEKRIRKLIRERKERDEHIQALIQKNEELTSNLRTKDKEVNVLGKSSLDASEKQLTDKIELARAVYTEAFEEGDKDKVLKAQEMLNDAQIDLKNVTAAQNNYQEIQEEVEPQQQVQQQPAPQRTDPRAEEWAADNDWFGKDNVMTAAALAIDAELKGEGYDPTDQDFYQEINKRIQSAFPQKFEESQNRVQENTSQPAQVVSGGSRSSPTSSKKVKLTKEDVRLAQKWDIPLERYAAEKLKVDDSDGYTNIL